ncbi:alpha-2-macroglobulin-like protein 1 [Osmerus eperlanus]|uniref:alpha-2-macroglobulin-like protein 1 n=1 Tax=Osmerus eperlanus TaxID=29151 RepID=UPI002E0DC67E
MLCLALVILTMLLQTATSRQLNEDVYLVTMSSQVVGGSMESLCAHIHNPSEPLSLRVILQLVQGQPAMLLEKTGINNDFYSCISFRVPLVVLDTVATLSVSVTGGVESMLKDTKILIRPASLITLVQTDKPIYKPGQKVLFRVVSLTSGFGSYDQMYKTVEIQDPNSNRIAQWLNQPTVSAILDLSHPTTPEAAQGRYTITIWNERDEQTSTGFDLKEYVLPKYEVTVSLPSVITIQDTEVTLRVCGKYTYGKPVLGSVTVKVCRKSFEFFRRPGGGGSDICEKYNMAVSGPTGCAAQVVNVISFGVSQWGYQDLFEVQAEIEESGTGVVLKGSGSATFTSVIRQVTFEDVSAYYKPGVSYQGKIKMMRPDSSPAANEPVFLFLTGGGPLVNWTLTTDSNGVVVFSLVTTLWTDSVSLQARSRLEEVDFLSGQERKPEYTQAYHYITAFYSKSNSSVSLQYANQIFSCEANAAILATYIIKGNEWNASRRTLDFFYMVMSRGSVLRHGRISVSLMEDSDNQGDLLVPLRNVAELAPVAQVVVYAIMPSGVIVADSLDFPVQLCLKNKVSLQFASPQELPGEGTSLRLTAHPGSLCSVRAIDQSVLLLQPEEELSVKSVYRLLPVQKLSGYDYNIQDADSSTCTPGRPPMPLPMPVAVDGRSFSPFWLPHNMNDVYTVFRDIGMKILTNSDVRKPVNCDEYFMMMARPQALPGSPDPMAPQRGPEKAETVRTYFPETWIWDLVPVGNSGSVTVQKTVPDTITQWAAGAFCMSPVGLGLAPSTALTAFQPFFVSLTLPYSVIRGEVFALRATVFNYLTKCIMVKVTLSKSDQFCIKTCGGYQYQLCVCPGESRTFRWIITPTALGEVSVKVSAEAIKTTVLCGKELPIVPERGRIDTVIQTLLVEAEGTQETVSYNILLCPAGGAVVEKLFLRLPAVFVIGSAKASLSVLGDLMGRALKNLDSLLAMPSGCGEQTMLQFAPNVYILAYLQSTQQLTPQIRDRAVAFLQGGYQNELTYKHSDGSYSAFGESDGSGNTWLTTFVMKSFGGARPFIFIDPVHITMAELWLAGLQQPTGCITSVGRLFHNDMQGGVSDDVSLTAYVTAALLELGHSTTDPMVTRCLTCLRSALALPLDNLYTVALLSYTFTLAGDQVTRRMLVTRLDQASIIADGARHWERSATPGSGLNSIDVEMTSYVLLALLSGPIMNDFGVAYAVGIVRWLVRQQNPYGGFSSTQDTVVALQALAKYGAATYSPEGATSVAVTSASGWRRDFTVNQQNRLLYQEQPLQDVPGEYTIRVEGQSCVFIQISLHYNIPPRPDFSSFTLTVEVGGLCKPKPSLKVVVTVRYNAQRKETNMVIIDFKLLSGFILDKSSLDALKTTNAVKRVDEKDGNVIIYVERLMQKEPMSFTLFILENFSVKNLKPAVVKVYDYYKTSDAAVVGYSSSCA